MAKTSQPSSQLEVPKDAGRPRLSPTRTVTMEVAITYSERVASPEHQIMEAVVDGMMHLDEREMLFPGTSWPPLDERLIGVSAKILSVERQAHDPGLADIRESAAAHKPSGSWLSATRSEATQQLETELGALEGQLEAKSRVIHGALARIWKAQESLIGAQTEEMDAAGFDETAGEAWAAVTASMRALGQEVGEL